VNSLFAIILLAANNNIYGMDAISNLSSLFMQSAVQLKH
jgi:hypothetical protein